MKKYFIIFCIFIFSATLEAANWKVGSSPATPPTFTPKKSGTSFKKTETPNRPASNDSNKSVTSTAKASQEGGTFVLVLKAEKTKIGKEVVFKTSISYPKEKTKATGAYLLNVLDASNKSIGSQLFDIDLERTYCPDPRWFNPVSGKQIFIPKSSDKDLFGKEPVYHFLLIPFDSRIKTLQLMTAQEKKVLFNTTVSHLTEATEGSKVSSKEEVLQMLKKIKSTPAGGSRPHSPSSPPAD